MKKLTSVVFLFCLVGLWGCGEKAQNSKISLSKSSIELANLKGKVRSLTIEQYEGTESFGKVQALKRVPIFTSESVYKSYLKYNQDGNIIEEYDYDSLGNIELKIQYEYDGKLFKKANYYENGGSLSSYFIAEYDLENLQANGSSFNSNDELIRTNNVLYTNFKEAKESNHFNEEGKQTARSIYKYDDKNRISEAIDYGRDGSLSYKMKS